MFFSPAHPKLQKLPASVDHLDYTLAVNVEQNVVMTRQDFPTINQQETDRYEHHHLCINLLDWMGQVDV